jgi:hypothetical protein
LFHDSLRERRNSQLRVELLHIRFRHLLI